MEGDDEELVLLTKEFTKFLKKISKQSKPTTKSSHPSKPVDFDKKIKRIQYIEYGGFGNTQSECANTIKRKSKAILTPSSEVDMDKS